MTRKWLGALLCVLGGAACDGGGGDAALRVLEGAATPLVQIGPGAPAFAEFGRIRDLALDDLGNVYVLDAHSRQVHVYDSTGSAVTSFAGQGSGPGELESPRGMRWGPGGTLWVMGYRHNRYTEYSPDGTLTRTFQRPMPPRGTDWRGVFDADDRLYEVVLGSERPGSEGRREVLVRYDVEGDALLPADTLLLPERVAPSYSVNFPGGMLSLPVPFAASASWALDGDDGAIWYGSGDDADVVKTDASGDTLVAIRLPGTRSRVTAEDRAGAIAELDSVLSAVGGDRRQVDFDAIPHVLPTHGRILVDRNSRVWIAQYTPNVEPVSTFHVYESSGEPIGSLQLSISARLPIAFGSSTVAGVTRDEFGVDHVVVYRVRFPDSP